MTHQPVDTRAALLNTTLNDRILWYDGESAFDPSSLLSVVNKYDVHHVTHESPDVLKFNKNVSREQEITVKTTCANLLHDWNIPQKYKQLDVIDYLSQRHISLTHGMNQEECDARDHRLMSEIKKYDEFELFDVLRTIIWIINTLDSNNIVWGVGRGSSVSSYVLYVIGVHDVDSYLYDLDIDDFLHA